MVRKKADEKTLEVANMIVEATNLNDMIYAFSEQAGTVLKALPRQKTSGDFDGLLGIMIKLSELQVATTTQLEIIAKAIKESKEKHHSEQLAAQEASPPKH